MVGRQARHHHCCIPDITSDCGQLRLCQAWHKRKNWLFSDKPKGATASAQLYSLVETAKANVQEPHAYLRYTLERLPQANNVDDYEALLPWNCQPLTAL